MLSTSGLRYFNTFISSLSLPYVIRIFTIVSSPLNRGYTTPYSVFSTSAAVFTCHFKHKNSRYYINFTAHNAGLAVLGDIMYVVSCKGSMWRILRLLPYQATSPFVFEVFKASLNCFIRQSYLSHNEYRAYSTVLSFAYSDTPASMTLNKSFANSKSVQI